MRSLTVPNANVALAEVLQEIYMYQFQEAQMSDIPESHRQKGKLWSTTDSRNGPVIKSNTPFTTAYLFPQQRVSFDPIRDGNPFFHYLEAMWMVAGRNDVVFPSYYAANIANYSDDGKTLNGAYGYRWRQLFGEDQIELIIKELKADPLSRRCVLQMWNAMPFVDLNSCGERVSVKSELASVTKDKCCNMSVVFQARKGFRPHEDTAKNYLDMTVYNRSNDIVYGAYGANSVHFSVLHELVSMCTDLCIGTYYQVSNNFHLYTEFPIVQKLLTATESGAYTNYAEQDLYVNGVVATDLFVDITDDSFEECSYDGVTSNLSILFQAWDTMLPNKRMYMCSYPVTNEMFGAEYAMLPKYLRIALAMISAYEWHKVKDYEQAKRICAAYMTGADDWRIACLAWLERREQNYLNNKEGVVEK